MRTYIYNSGMAALSAQDGQNWKLVFSGFKVSSAVNQVFNAANNALADVTYTGGPNEITYVPITDEEVLLQCTVDREFGEYGAATIQLLVNSNVTNNIPFAITIATDQFTKLKNNANIAVGTKLVYQLMLSMPQLTSRFSFVNLKTNVAKFHHSADENVMPRFAWEEPYDQLIIDKHTQTGALIFGMNAWDDYWGCPLAANMDSTNMFWKITGGRVGDGHRYVDAS